MILTFQFSIQINFNKFFFQKKKLINIYFLSRYIFDFKTNIENKSIKIKKRLSEI
jgi:hypothetical protein